MASKPNGKRIGESLAYRRSTEIEPFVPIVILSFLFFGGAGLYLRAHNPPAVTITDRIAQFQDTRFILEERSAPPRADKPKPRAKPEKTIPEEPVDLTEKPVLAQEKEDIVQPPPDQKSPETVRRIYGLKKVYSTGIGASGDAADAIIGKKGNTLDTGIDTVTATQSDLRSVPVSITTVTSYPRLSSQVKPEYTKEMLQNRIEGVIRVKVLVDVDGRVKKAVVLDDLGFGSKEKVAEACFRMTFEPARRGEEPVSVWIMMRIRFEMLQG